jgi:hypothetical protein
MHARMHARRGPVSGNKLSVRARVAVRHGLVVGAGGLLRMAGLREMARRGEVGEIVHTYVVLVGR